MPNILKPIRVEIAKRALSNQSNKNRVINVSNNEAVNNVLNDIFVRQEQLTKARLLRKENIRQINTNYITATQGVLDDKTLDFLIKHSQIDAPTLTSIFAGFELAKASRAKKLDEQRQTDIAAVQATEKLEADAIKNQALLSQSKINQINATRKDALTQTGKEATALISAATGDIVAEERRVELGENRTLSEINRKVDADAKIKAAEIKAFAANAGNIKANALADIERKASIKKTVVSDNESTLDVGGLNGGASATSNNPLTTSSIADNEVNPIGSTNLGTVNVPDVLDNSDVPEVDLVGLAEFNASLNEQPSTSTDNINSVTDPVSSITNPITTDSQILFSPDVVEQINLLNGVNESVTIDLLSFQQSLIDDGIDPLSLTVEDINNRFNISGVPR